MPPEMRDDTAFMDRIHAYVPGWDVPKVSREQLTDHFGLVSDFLSSCWNHLRASSRLQKIQGRIQFGGALSGRDTNAVQKTMNGLLKLMFPYSNAGDGEGAEYAQREIPEAAIEWAARLALECRRRVKEQQKRIGSAEFRNTHFSYQMGIDGVEQFVTTPELQSEDSIGDDPLPPGQAWVLSPGGPEEHPGLFRLDVTEGPGSGVRILNQPPPAPIQGEPALRRAEPLRPRQRAGRAIATPGRTSSRSNCAPSTPASPGAGTGVGALLALCSALLEKSLKGGLIVVGGLNLGGSIEPIYNAVGIVEAAVDKGAKTILLPVTTRKQLVELDDDIATRVTVVFYGDARDALLKALME